MNEPERVEFTAAYPGGRPAESVIVQAAQDATAGRISGQLAFALRLNSDGAAQSNSSPPRLPVQAPVLSGNQAPNVPGDSNGKVPPQPSINTVPSPPAAGAAPEEQPAGGASPDHGRRRPEASIRPPAGVPPGPAENIRQDSASPVLHSAEGLKPEPAAASPARSVDAGQMSAPPAPEPAAAEVRPPAPLREFSLSVRSDPAAPDHGDVSRVGLRVRLSGDEVQVAVHAPDPRASEQLRRDLGTLAERLDQSGYHTETWRPAESGPAAGAPSRGADRETANPGGTPDEGSRGGRQGEQRQQQRQRPAWVEELEQQKARLA